MWSLSVSVRLASTFTSVDAVNGSRDGTGAAPDAKTDSGPTQLYEHRLSTGELRPDENQLVVVRHLQKLSDDLDGYKHQQRRSDGMLSGMSSVRIIFSLGFLKKIHIRPCIDHVSVTAWHSSSGRQPNCALNRGRHLSSTGRPSLWALARIPSSFFLSFFLA